MFFRCPSRREALRVMSGSALIAGMYGLRSVPSPRRTACRIWPLRWKMSLRDPLFSPSEPLSLIRLPRPTPLVYYRVLDDARLQMLETNVSKRLRYCQVLLQASRAPTETVREAPHVHRCSALMMTTKSVKCPTRVSSKPLRLGFLSSFRSLLSCKLCATPS